MEKPYLLHMITAAKNLSPFDVNMAYDAGWTACTAYSHVALEEVTGLIQDAIFSRGPRGVARTGVFLGGRDIHLAMDMLAAARAAMVPPFEVSVFADPSGAFTTAAAMVAGAEGWLRRGFQTGLAGLRVLVFGGTGPVGSAAAILSARAGAQTQIVSLLDLPRAQEAARHCNEHCGVEISAAYAGTDEEILALMDTADLVFNAAAAGVQVLRTHQVGRSARLKVACDVNAVPPAGIEGIGVMDNGAPLPGAAGGALGLGALAVGTIKYRVQQGLLRQMHEADSPQYLGLDAAFEMARRHVE